MPRLAREQSCEEDKATEHNPASPGTPQRSPAPGGPERVLPGSPRISPAQNPIIPRTLSAENTGPVPGPAETARPRWRRETHSDP